LFTKKGRKLVEIPLKKAVPRAEYFCRSPFLCVTLKFSKF
jgi:hypothetical protein